MTPEMIKARKSQLKYYRNVELYRKTGGQDFVLYKRAGITLQEMRIKEGRHPSELYIRHKDRLKGIQEAQKGLNRQLKDDSRSGSPNKVRETLLTIVEETFTEPRSGSLEGVSETISTLVDDYSRESSVVSSLVDMSYQDYSTVLHSINVMALTLGFAFYNDYPPDEAKTLGLCALLHDVGKTKIKKGILAAPRKLSDEEFEEMKGHTTLGYNILRECNFSDNRISRVALEHHEKLDGTGYPVGKTRISQTTQIIGMIDCYEALTNNDRPYRNAMEAFDTLSQVVIKDVKSGKFSKEIYSEFVKSLGGKGMK